MSRLFTLFFSMLFLHSFKMVSTSVNFNIRSSACNKPNSRHAEAFVNIENTFTLANAQSFTNDFEFKTPCSDFKSQTLTVQLISQEYVIILGNQELVFEGDDEEFDGIAFNDLESWWKENIAESTDIVMYGDVIDNEEDLNIIAFQTVPREFLAQIQALGLEFNPEDNTYFVQAEDEDVIPFKHSESPEDFNLAQLFAHGSSELE